MNLAWWLHSAAREHGDNVALINPHSGNQFTYRDLDQRTALVAAALRDVGVAEDDVVVTLLQDDEWHYCVFFATLKIGGVFSGLNRNLKIEKHRADIERMRARVMVVSSEFVEVAEALLESTCLQTIIVNGESAAGHPSLAQLMQNAVPVERIAPRTSEQLCAVNFTGGTSGVSKGVTFTHGKLGLSAHMATLYSDMRSTDVNVSVIGLFHSGGIADALRWTMVGGTNILLGAWNVDVLVRAIQRYKPTFIMAIVPTMVRDWMRHPEFDSLDLKGMRAIVSGETVPKGMRVALRDRGMRITTVYGLTETMPWAVLGVPFVWQDDELLPELSVGKAMPEFCEVVLKEAGGSGAVISTPGVSGEICIRGEIVSPGYYNDPERTAAAWDNEGWFHTRDLGWFDEDGWYYVTGRVDDVINTGGEKLSLIELEDVLKACPQVVDAACIGVPHDRFGLAPAAIVVTSDDLEPQDVPEVLNSYMLENLERWKRPRLYVPIAAIPRTDSKRTKDLAALREILDGVTLADDGRVISLSQWHQEAAASTSDVASAWPIASSTTESRG